MKKILLYRDTNKLAYAKNDEIQKERVLQKIKEVVKIAMDTNPINYNELIEKGSSVLVDAYISEFSPNFPKHLNKENRFTSDTNINLKKLDDLISEYNRYGLSQPKITSSGELISTIKDTDFDVYLNESDRDFYNTVIAFKDIINKVQAEKFIHMNYHSTAIQLTKYLYFNPQNPKQAILRPESFK